MVSIVERRAGLVFHHRNASEFDLIYREIFDGHEYAVQFDRPDPHIVDCGGHVGVSIAWWASRWPSAHICVFEPDPGNFELLLRTVHANGFERVRAENKAVDVRTGRARFYGDFTSARPEASAHSLEPFWGAQRGETWMEVDTVAIADVITQPVDLLKLDVEGAEVRLLPSLGAKLPLIRRIICEYHGRGSAADAELASLESLLAAAGFEVNVERKDVTDIFPDDIREWVARTAPVLAVIRCARE